MASVSAIYGLGDPQSYLRMVLHLDRGDKFDQRQIIRRLAELSMLETMLFFSVDLTESGVTLLMCFQLSQKRGVED